jgi:hypothetical protein
VLSQKSSFLRSLFDWVVVHVPNSVDLVDLINVLDCRSFRVFGSHILFVYRGLPFSFNKIVIHLKRESDLIQFTLSEYYYVSSHIATQQCN